MTRTVALRGAIATLRRRLGFHGMRWGHRGAPLAARTPPPGPLVLCYHHVAAAESPYVSELGVTIHPTHFAAQLQFLRRHYRIRPFSAFERGEATPDDAAITFDDGFLSIRTRVLPLLERWGLPAKLYLTTENLRTGINWTNQLSYLMRRLGTNALTALADEGLRRPLERRGQPPLRDEFLEYFDPEVTPAAVDAAFRAAHPSPPPRLFLTIDEARALARHPLLEIGSHTARHYPLHVLNERWLADEVSAAHATLNEWLAGRAHGFCMPFGHARHRTAAVVRRVGDIDRRLVTAYGGPTFGGSAFGMPEIRRLGVWGTLGVLLYRLADQPKDGLAEAVA